MLKLMLWLRPALSLLVVLTVAATALPPLRVLAQDVSQPESVAIPGSLSSKLGCSGDWMPDCENGFLTYDADNDIWKGTFEIPAGNYEYKAALNGSWDENYGANAAPGGGNISLSLAEDTVVTFYYDHKSHLIADNHGSVIATLVGDFQGALGCSADDPTCLRTWLQDIVGSGAYTFVSTDIPAGDYQVRVAINESLDEVYGAGGVLGGEAIAFNVPEDGKEIYFGYDAVTHKLIVSSEGAPRGSLDKLQAYWVAQDTILWDVADSLKYSYYLHYNPSGALKLGVGEILGGEQVALRAARADSEVLAKFPHLARLTALKVADADLALVPAMLKGQAAVSVWDEDGKLVDATALQIPGVLDDLYAYDGPLGVTFDGDVPTLRVWAPTAQTVKLHLFDDAAAETSATVLEMSVDADSGVWSIAGDAGWNNKFYLYEVTVFVPLSGQVETNLVTDPYALGLSMNSARSQIVDLFNAEDLKPTGWEGYAKPALEAPEDIVLYELHVRDFSFNDSSVPEDYRGTYKAFTVLESAGMQHLKALADAGLTHLHLLPTFDIASIDEDRSTWSGPTFDELAAYAPDSEEQQALLAPVRDQDGFNWGYDPFHYTVPEGSYSTDPNGTPRIVEFREMVKALNEIGLRVVMDVVYNHTNASGLSAKSVLDKVVPGYYHRLNGEGAVERSTCCENTASEHVMMEKLMIDSLVTWAKAYKVDGFRFDLMGHHMLENMAAARTALDALTLEADGVDGSKIYIYGEGWDFGEVAENARGINATQLNIGGSGIGAFNDRLRDAARGGSPFSGLQDQGFITGLYDAPNAAEQRDLEAQKEQLIEYAYWIRVGLAGSLQDYKMLNTAGKPASGNNIFYNSSPTGYTQDPQECINYVSAHDNETLFDAIQLKAPESASMADRVRMHNLGVNLVMLGQGIPFFHAGTDMLRSKSMDRNSYNSGDWYNRLDFTYASNNWGAGLPPADNQGNWAVMGELLADPTLTPTQDDILAAVDNFQEMLQIRKSSKLFRLESAADIAASLQFLNVGAEQTPGLIVMSLLDKNAVDDNYDLIVVLFNATQSEQLFAATSFEGLPLALHPVQADSYDSLVQDAAFDPVLGAFSVPGRTTAVFVSAQAPDEIIPPALEPEPEVVVEPTAEPEPEVVETAEPVVQITDEVEPLSTPEPEESSATGIPVPVILSMAIGFAILASAFFFYQKKK